MNTSVRESFAYVCLLGKISEQQALLKMSISGGSLGCAGEVIACFMEVMNVQEMKDR